VSESRPESTGSDPTGPEPTAEELVGELQKIKVGDLLFHTATMLASIAYGKLAPETRDLDDAKLAVDALRALMPLMPEDQRPGIQQVVSNLQLAYADAAAG
jgi:hypothetical protein